uniref:Uncharacterized protein n=1 Tax=Rhizophora mucronata TaxID=61149 RepID=A0A2P2P4T4_RHIMU
MHYFPLYAKKKRQFTICDIPSEGMIFPCPLFLARKQLGITSPLYDFPVITRFGPPKFLGISLWDPPLIL